MFDNRPPLVLHVLNFADESLYFLWGVFVTTRCGFVVVKICVRGPDVLVAGLHDLQAQIHIIERNLQVFGVKPSHFLENRLLDDQTCGGNSRHTLN